MSELAFDKDGEPIEVHPDTEWWAVRAFQNPGARGTCSIARDDEGAPIHIEREGGFLDLKRAVRAVPALYRLDQCDGSRARIVGAQAAYVLITESQRNGGLGAGLESSSHEPLVLVLMELIRAQSDALRVTAKEQSNMMRAASDLLRAADQAGISRRPAPPPSPVNEVDDEDEDEDEDEDDDDDQPPPKHIAQVIAEKIIPKVDLVLSHWISKKMKSEPPPPAAAPSPAPASATPTPPAPAAAPSAGAAPPAAAAAGASPATPPRSAPATPPAAAGATVTETVETTTVTVTPSPSAAADDSVRNATASPTITPEQIQHLLTIQARLTPREQAIANLVRERMSPEQQAQWLAELSAMTVEQALELVRSMIPKPASKRPPGVPTSTAPPPTAPSTETALAVTTPPTDAPEDDE